MKEYDALVVGSGFGGSVAALRLAEKGYHVGVLEAGRRFGPGDFPRTSWNLRRYLFFPRLGLRGIQRLTLLRDVLVLSGAGVGGGSLVYANVLYEPPASVWPDPTWAEELRPYYELARRMLGAAEVPFETPADEAMRKVAERMGAAETFRRTEVGVFFGEPGVEVDDPYFGGAGPRRAGCIRCGGCMVGCRHGAKNTLDRNYLHLAERLGAEVWPEREAVLLRRAGRGWEVDTVRPGPWLRRRPETFRAAEVVLAAGVLGTLRLLFRSGLGGPRVGELVRTNSEALVGASARRRGVDHSTGVAIGSSFEPDPRTQIQPVRYPRGSNAMGLLGKSLPGAGLGAFLRSLSVHHWSERTIVLLVMQARDNALRVRWTGRRLTTEQVDNPRRLPVAERAARLTAELIGGDPGGPRLRRSMTAHILGGACVGAVLDRYQRVLSEPGLHVVDGSALNANLGVNPSLTIAAQAERALAFWPRKGEPEARPPLA